MKIAEKHMANQCKKHKLEKYIQLVTTLSLTIRAISSCV